MGMMFASKRDLWDGIARRAILRIWKKTEEPVDVSSFIM